MKPRYVRGNGGYESFGPEACDYQSDRSAEETEQHALGDQLHDDAAPDCAECDADGKFALAAGSLRQQEGGDIGDCDQQDEHDCQQHDEHWATIVSERGFAQPHDDAVYFELRLDGRGIPVADDLRDAFNVSLRLGQRNSGLEARDGVVAEVFANGLTFFLGERHWHPEFRGVELLLACQDEVFVHDTNNRVRLSAEHDVLAEDVGIRSKKAAPNARAEDDDFLIADPIFVSGEVASEPRCRTENREGVRRYARALHLARLALAGEVVGVLLVSGNIGE